MPLRAAAGLRPSANDEQWKLVFAMASFVVRLGKHKSEADLVNFCRDVWGMALVAVWALVGGEFGE